MIKFECAPTEELKIWVTGSHTEFFGGGHQKHHEGNYLYFKKTAIGRTRPDEGGFDIIAGVCELNEKTSGGLDMVKFLAAHKDLNRVFRYMPEKEERLIEGRAAILEGLPLEKMIAAGELAVAAAKEAAQPKAVPAPPPVVTQAPVVVPEPEPVPEPPAEEPPAAPAPEPEAEDVEVHSGPVSTAGIAPKPAKAKVAPKAKKSPVPHNPLLGT